MLKRNAGLYLLVLSFMLVATECAHADSYKKARGTSSRKDSSFWTDTALFEEKVCAALLPSPARTYCNIIAVRTHSANTPAQHVTISLRRVASLYLGQSFFKRQQDTGGQTDGAVVERWKREHSSTRASDPGVFLMRKCDDEVACDSDQTGCAQGQDLGHE